MSTKKSRLNHLALLQTFIVNWHHGKK